MAATRSYSTYPGPMERTPRLKLLNMARESGTSTRLPIHSPSSWKLWRSDRINMVAGRQPIPDESRFMADSTHTLKDRFLGYLLGCAVGDALGAPFEGL